MSRSLSTRRLRASLLGLAAAGLLAASAAAQAAWPDRPIQMVVPFPAGSSPDILARAIAEPLSADLGQPIVVDNKPGAGGNIGTRFASKAKPDGYTILLTINGPMVTAPTLYKKTLGYDPLKDLAPITLVGTSPNVLVVPAGSPAGNAQEFVAMAKSKPGELNYGTVGPGSSSHLAMAMLEHQAGIKLQQIPYTGFPQIITSILAGDIQAGFMVPGIAMSQVKAGKAKILGITSLQPSDVLPGLPTMAEQGFKDFESISWDAIFVPAGTPDDIVRKLNAAIRKVIERDEVKAKMAALYFTPAASTPEELTALVVNEKKRWDEVINRLGLSLD
ncbi:Bug family tripartite tricarboxylate transporter substrate binding protein [Parapusillimonas granuli]|uniref:Tripartite tricarboxylate transporter substrate binding protein n=1 Tax=Parapusillimonas granuli TaxID=380911 RepID=A0A853FSF7_9BURK|nr:tripartite tricarboxylate transporter substrate binding protein [Parapusillimonas granuli]MBB5214768.1 tripartite-type tricarboxylate transporter receptor subunit TctC [Parapusillimonas granuli]MEB2397984.1 tripartite tricarboxylate transporter substrate binding protein [Alcaligenaceae bacterium]NYT48824.1 tripartite tricarboxylate transporter substrate binding protein [Parapusillimonas granuli]